MNIEETRDDLLAAALPHVAFEGWNTRALDAGAADLGLNADTPLLAFPGGAREMAVHYFNWSNRRMLDGLDHRALIRARVRDRVTLCVRDRLEQKADHKEAVRRLVAFLALPPNAPIAARGTWRAVSEIWYAAGDNATDWNWYSKRSLLYGVYSSTFLFWLNDTSEDHQNSWDFLDRRIADVMRIQTLRGTIDRAAENAPRVLRALGGFVRAGR